MIFPDFDILTEFIWFLKTNNIKIEYRPNTTGVLTTVRSRIGYSADQSDPEHSNSPINKYNQIPSDAPSLTTKGLVCCGPNYSPLSPSSTSR